MSQCHIHQIHQTRNNSTSPGLGPASQQRPLCSLCVCVCGLVYVGGLQQTQQTRSHMTHTVSMAECTPHWQWASQSTWHVVSHTCVCVVEAAHPPRSWSLSN